MSPNELAESIESLILKADNSLYKSISALQRELYDILVLQLKELEVDSTGAIIQSASNRRILSEAQTQIDSIVKESSYPASIEKYIKNITEIDGLNSSYFSSISDAFKPNRVFIKQLQAQTIKSVNTLMLQDGFVAQIGTPLNNILVQNVNTGGSFSGMLKEVETFINGNPELDGRLLSYSKNTLKDTLFQYSRSYQQSVTKDLGLEWYRYVGGLIDTSRPFCIERAGKYYHQKEIEDWASLQWAGRNRFTTASSIFVVAGGYGCGHSIVPVDISIVPQDVINRNIKSGNYKESA